MEKAVSWKKILIFAIAVCLFAGIIVKCNQFQKTPLASYKGQKYEKAVVTKIIKDNLAEDGTKEKKNRRSIQAELYLELTVK